jgi:glucose-1-phosphate thymidylyltransferase
MIDAADQCGEGILPLRHVGVSPAPVSSVAPSPSSSESMKAVILARGLGKRMRQAAPGARLSPEQEAAARQGVKALIPIGRPFLDYVLSALADAGWRRVCLVIGPEHDAVREYYARLPMRRITVEMAIQKDPLGTADAVAAAEAFAAGESFLCINSDNYYPREALTALRAMSGLGLAAFERDGLLAGSNIPPDRIARFGLLSLDSQGRLRRVVEKPTESQLAAMPLPIFVSMNCWRFGPAIFPACRSIGRSSRGELELTDAVQYAIDHLGARFETCRCAAPVLDMTGQEDVASMARHLAGVKVEL